MGGRGAPRAGARFFVYCSSSRAAVHTAASIFSRGKCYSDHQCVFRPPSRSTHRQPTRYPNLIRLAVAAREASGAPRAVPAIDEHRSDDAGVEPADEVEERWMRRLAAILDAPTGENSSDAAQLTTGLWIGGRSAAMDVLAANSRGITDLVNICEPWCPLGPNSENIQYVGIEAEDRASFPILSDKWYRKIRSHVCAGRKRGAVFLIHSDVGANRSAAIAAALLLDDGSIDRMSAC